MMAIKRCRKVSKKRRRARRNVLKWKRDEQDEFKRYSVSFCVTSDMGFSAKERLVFNCLLHDTVVQASRLAYCNMRSAITTSEIQAALRLLAEELYEYAVCEAEGE
jgi:hypothetical protein